MKPLTQMDLDKELERINQEQMAAMHSMNRLDDLIFVAVVVIWLIGSLVMMFALKN